MSLAAMPNLAAESAPQRYLKSRALRVVWELLDRMRQRSTIGLAIANPGCGKTFSLKLWRQSRSVRHVSIEADYLTGIHPILSALCRGIGLAPGGRRNLTYSRDALVDRLAADPVMVIVDQADMLKITALEVLRTIWDRVSEKLNMDGESAFPLVIFGTPELLARMMRPELERLHRRIDEIVKLEPLSPKEKRMALDMKWPGLRIDDDAFALLHRKTKGGSFGWLNKIVPKARELAAQDGGVITVRTMSLVDRCYLVGAPEDQ